MRMICTNELIEVTPDNIEQYSDTELQQMLTRCEDMLKDSPFEVATIHDSAWCHPNHMNNVRHHYVNIMAEIADSTLMQDILREITGTKDTYTKKGFSLAPLIRQANYALS